MLSLYLISGERSRKEEGGEMSNVKFPMSNGMKDNLTPHVVIPEAGGTSLSRQMERISGI